MSYLSTPTVKTQKSYRHTCDSKDDNSPSQHRDHAVGEHQPLGHHRDEIGQQLLAEYRVFDLERFELMLVQDIKNARGLGLDGGAARRMRDQPHFADGGVAAQTPHPGGAAFAGGDHDADAAVENEMHGIGGVAGVDDDVAGVDLEALAALHQL